MLGGLGVYLFIVHMVTAKKPFIPPVLFKDRNFAAGLVLMFATGTILVSSSSLMAPWLQNLANYPVETAGLIMAPRGIGTMTAMLTGGRLSSRMDPRKLMACGILMLAWSMWEMTGWTPDIAQWTIIVTIMVQGAGLGFRVPAAAGAGVRHPAAAVPHRWRVAVQPVPQHRRRGRRVGDVVHAGAQHAGAA